MIYWLHLGADVPNSIRLTNMPDNRDFATWFWLAVALSFILSSATLRAGVAQILRLFFGPVLLVPVLIMNAYIVLEVWLGARLGLWNVGLIKHTLLWVAGSAGVLFFTAPRASRDPQFFRKTVFATITVSTIVQFFMNVKVLSLPMELALQPFLAFLVLMVAVAETRAEFRRVKTIVEAFLAIVGLALCAFVVRQIYAEWPKLDRPQLLREFLLPLWLTVGILPFLYALSLFIAYDAAIRGINWATVDRRRRWRARLALVSKLHIRHRDVQAFTWKWAQEVAAAPHLAAARDVIERYLDARRIQAQGVAIRQELLHAHTGSDETDEQGRRLDRREFPETAEVMRSVASATQGCYRDGRYREELLRVFTDYSSQSGLPRPSDVVVRIADDGQAWFAWRRTVTGWVFGAAGSGAPSASLEYHYDGPDPPMDFPVRDQRWIEGSPLEQRAGNWTTER